MCRKMRRICIQIMISCLLVGGSSQTAYGRSVYAITNHESSTITAYDIDGTTLECQTDIAVPRGTGAVGLALDPESDTLFVTYDDINNGGHKIELMERGNGGICQ